MDKHFKLNVSHGQGLPPSLKDHGDEAPSPMAPGSGDVGDSIPDNVIPANFNDLKETIRKLDKIDSSKYTWIQMDFYHCKLLI